MLASIVVLIGVLTFVSPVAAQDALDRIRKDGVLKIANSGVYPPFEFKEGDKLVGFDVDLAELVAREMGVKPEISVIDFKGLIPSLKSGKVDLLISAITHTPARAEQVAFSKPYYETAIAVAVRGDRMSVASVKSKDDLSGLVLGAELGTTGEREARAVKGVKEVKTYDTLMLALRDLEIGRIDAIISTLPTLQYLIHRNFKKTQVVAKYNAGWVGINVKPEETRLLDEVNRIVEKLQQSGELDNLKMKWFGVAGR